MPTLQVEVMAAITKLKLVQQPTASSSGSRATVHRAIYEASVDEPMLGDMVCQLAQELVGALPAVNPDGSAVNEVPNPGDRLFWSGGQGLIPDTYALGTAGINAFLADGTVTGQKWYDAGSLALDFETVQLPDGCNQDWQIDVTYRPPEPGQNERPEQLVQLLSGRAGQGSPTTIPFTGAAYDASVERWIEHRPFRIPTSEGYLFNAPVLSSTLTPLRMPNGEEYPPIQRDAWVDVLVIARNVQDENYAHTLNQAYYNTCNHASLALGDRTQAAFTAHYETTRTGRPITRDSTTYYRAETRIVLHASPVFFSRQAYGSYYLESGKRKKALDEDGEPLPFVPLDVNGNLALPDGSNTHEVKVSPQRPVDYAAFAY